MDLGSYKFSYEPGENNNLKKINKCIEIVIYVLLMKLKYKFNFKKGANRDHSKLVIRYQYFFKNLKSHCSFFS